tara:strand:- start:1275 stop:1499 length:225 start_codon:yes stop_codon:yes gene_type:complete
MCKKNKPKGIRLSFDIPFPQFFLSEKGNHKVVLLESKDKKNNELQRDALIILASALNQMENGKCKKIVIKRIDE